MIIPGPPRSGMEKEAFSHKCPACCVGKLNAQRGCWPSSLGKVLVAGKRA